MSILFNSILFYCLPWHCKYVGILFLGSNTRLLQTEHFSFFMNFFFQIKIEAKYFCYSFNFLFIGNLTECNHLQESNLNLEYNRFIHKFSDDEKKCNKMDSNERLKMIKSEERNTSIMLQKTRKSAEKKATNKRLFALLTKKNVLYWTQ